MGICLASSFIGCQGGPKGPDFNPKQSAKDAIEQYDKDGDGALSESEIEACPGLLSAAPRVDVDKDGSITADEIARRIKYYKSAPVRVVSGSIRVLKKGKPLEGATVTFEPETFLGEDFQPCSGVTDDLGDTFISRENAEFPGIYLGFYRVRVSKIVKGKETIAKAYNTESTIGFESAADLPMVSNVPTFNVK
jgi:hypothetical protein